MSSIQNNPTDYTDIPERKCYVASRKGQKWCSLRLVALLWLCCWSTPRQRRYQRLMMPVYQYRQAAVLERDAASPLAFRRFRVQAPTVNGEKPLPEDFSVPELMKLKNGQSINSGTYPHPENDGRNPGGGVQAPDLLPLP